MLPVPGHGSKKWSLKIHFSVKTSNCLNVLNGLVAKLTMFSESHHDSHMGTPREVVLGHVR